MAALDGAVTLEQMNEPAVMVAKNLDLDVPRTFDIFLDQQSAVPEGAFGLPARGGQSFGKCGSITDDAHPAPTTAGGSFNEQRKTNARKILFVFIRRRNDRNSGLFRQLPCFHLGAHGANYTRLRSDEGNAGLLAGSGKIGVLRQKSIPRMNRIGAAAARGFENGFDVQIRLTRRRSTDRHSLIGHANVQGVTVEIRINRNGLDAHSAACPQDADGNFTTV